MMGSRSGDEIIAENGQFDSARGVISAAQIRMARAGLGWSQGDLAERCGVNIRTIRNIESDAVYARISTWQSIEDTLTSAGAEFQGDDWVRVPPKV